jgi:hypothetical protein
MPPSLSLFLILLVLGPKPNTMMSTQESTKTIERDPFTQRVDEIELRAESIFDAIGRLNQSFDIAISIEGILPAEGTVTNPKFTVRIENRSLAEVLTLLCELDNRYSWARDGKMVNLFPRALQNDPTYLFNQRLPVLHFENIREVSDAVMQVIHQVPGPPKQLIYWGLGGTQNFAKPLSVTYDDLTVRQAMNRIAQQLGPTFGWQVGGHSQTPAIVFHYKLGTRPGYDVPPTGS